MSFAQKLVSFLSKIAVLKRREFRDRLLRNLPQDPVSFLERSNASRLDLENIVDSAQEWGWIEEQVQYALEIVMSNTVAFVEGTGLEKELNALREEFRNTNISDHRLHILHLFGYSLGNF